MGSIPASLVRRRLGRSEGPSGTPRPRPHAALPVPRPPRAGAAGGAAACAAGRASGSHASFPRGTARDLAATGSLRCVKPEAGQGGAGQAAWAPRTGSWRGPETLGRGAWLALQALKCPVSAWEDLAPWLGTDYPQHRRVKKLDMLGASPVRAHREPKRRSQTGTRPS